MMTPLEDLANWWISRAAAPEPEAVAAAARSRPTVVVTGGSSGIGLELARAFARSGRDVLLVARNAERLDRAARSLRDSASPEVDTLILDVGTEAAPRLLLDHLAADQRYCDVLVNSAGLGAAGPFASAEPASLDALIATNVAGLARLTRAMLPGMLARGRGGILSIASLAGLVPGPHQAAYYASKAFVISLSEAIASETAGRGVRVAVVLPGPVETRFHARMGAEDALYRFVLGASTPELVAARAIRGYRLGRRVIAPGFVPTLAVYALRILPHAISVPAVKWLLAVERPDAP